MQRAVLITQSALAALLALVLYNSRGALSGCAMYVAALALIECFYAAHVMRRREAAAQCSAIACAAIFALAAWELSAVNLKIANPILLPPPRDVFQAFWDCRGLMARGIFSSLALLCASMAIALAAGVTLGLFTVALMPTFRSAAAAIIILGIFWPTFMGIINRAASMDRRIINSARALGLTRSEMIIQIMIPYLFPGIMAGLHVTLSTSFLLLTMAEMMGASSGLGYFIKNYSDYANYTNVIAGIILIGIVVSLLNALLSYSEKKLVRWKE